MSSFLDDIRDGFESVIDKTEEYGKIGKIKVDIAGLNRQLDKFYAELGKTAYQVINDKQDVTKSAQIKDVIEKIQSCQADIAKKEAEIEDIKHQKEQERKKRTQERKKEKESREEQKQAQKTKPGDVEDDSDGTDIEDAKIVNEKDKKK